MPDKRPLQLVNYRKNGEIIFAFLVEGKLYRPHQVHCALPRTAQQFLDNPTYYSAMMEGIFEDLHEPQYAKLAPFDKVEDVVGMEVVEVPKQRYM